MTKFNPEDKTTLTYSESLGPAMQITEQQDADQYFADYVAHIQQQVDREPPRGGREDASNIARGNLGYYAGYYDSETRERVEQLFSCAHPILGKAANGTPTSAQALAAGKSMAKLAR